MSRRKDRRVPGYRQPRAGAAAPVTPPVPPEVAAGLAWGEGRDIMAGIQMAAGGTTFSQPGGPVGIFADWQDTITAGLAAGTIRCCPHLSATDPKPMIWLAWEPGLLGCRNCAADSAAKINGTAEDEVCDQCGATSQVLHVVAGDIPAGIFGQFGIGPVIMHGGLCWRCDRDNRKLNVAAATAASPRIGRAEDPPPKPPPGRLPPALFSERVGDRRGDLG